VKQTGDTSEASAVVDVSTHPQPVFAPKDESEKADQIGEIEKNEIHDE